MDFAPLLSLLRRPYSAEICRRLLRETGRIYREDFPERWYFLLLNRVLVQILENPDLYEADTSEPVIEVVAASAQRAIDAIKVGDLTALTRAANEITEAYCGIR